MEPDEHLFRREAGRLVAALTRIFGVRNLALAEDVVQDAFCRALEVWQVPRRARRTRRRGSWPPPSIARSTCCGGSERRARSPPPSWGGGSKPMDAAPPVVEELFGPHAIKDDQLRMMFSCCHPRLPEEAQVALMLHILCGFGVDEVAARLRQPRDAAIEKRIGRAKKVLAGSKRLFEIDGRCRLRAGGCRPSSARSTSCSTRATTAPRPSRPCVPSSAARRSASRGCSSSIPLAATPATHALAALMCLHAARLPARLDVSRRT